MLNATVTDVTWQPPPPANSTIGQGETVLVQVDFSEAVDVDTTGGTPTIQLNDFNNSTASYIGGSGTTSLLFSLVVPSGDFTSPNPLDYTSTTALSLNGGTINDDPADGDTNAADLTLPTLGGVNDNLAAGNIVIDDTAAPTILSVATNTASGTYGANQTIDIELNLSKAVTVTSGSTPPTLTLTATNGGNPVTAVYDAADSTATQLVFTYNTQAGDTTNGQPLDYSASGLSLGDYTFTDDNSSQLGTTLPTPAGANDGLAAANIIIDATTPSVSNVTSSTANGTYGTGATVSIQVTFSEVVTVTGTPQLALNSGGTANYSSGSGTNTLTFTYTVGAGDSTHGGKLDYTSTSALSLNGGTIQNGGGNNANLVLPADSSGHSLSDNTNIVIDATTPSVTSVSTTTASGTYGAGQTITIAVGFSEVVNVTGTPAIQLSDGRTATYSSGSGSNTLVFTYTVQAGDTTNGQPLDYTSTTALGLNGGTIRSAAGTDADLTLPAPGSANDGLAAANIVINAPTPTPTPTPPSTFQAAFTLFVAGVELVLEAHGVPGLPAPSELIAIIQSNLPFAGTLGLQALVAGVNAANDAIGS